MADPLTGTPLSPLTGAPRMVPPLSLAAIGLPAGALALAAPFPP